MNRLYLVIVLFLMFVGAVTAQTQSMRYFVSYGVVTKSGERIPVSQVRMFPDATSALVSYWYLSDIPTAFHTVQMYGSKPIPRCTDKAAHGPNGMIQICLSGSPETTPKPAKDPTDPPINLRKAELPEPRPALLGKHGNE